MTARAGLTVVGQIVGASVGGALGAAIGGAVGSIVGGALDGPTRTTQALIDDLSAIKFEYGASWPRLYGRYRVKVAPIWSSTKRPVEHDEEIDSKGGPDQINRTFTYEQDWLCWAPLGAAGWVRIWINGKLRASRLSDADADTIEASAATPAWAAVTFFDGAADQLPWAVYEAAVGAADACAYRYRPTIAFSSLDLGNSGQPPLIEVEFYSEGTSTSTGFLEDFETDYPGEYTITNGPGAAGLAAGPWGNCLSLAGLTRISAFGTIVWREIDTNGPISSVKFNFRVDAPFKTVSENTNGRAPTIEVSKNDGADILFAFGLGENEYADPLQRPRIAFNGGSFSLLSSVLLGVDVWYECSLELAPPTGCVVTIKMLETGDVVYLSEHTVGSVVWEPTRLRIYGDWAYSWAGECPGGSFDQIYFGTPADLAAPDTVALSDIVLAEETLSWSGEAGALASGQIDVSELASTLVTGFLTTGSPRESIAQLMDVYYFGVTCSDKLYHRLRGAAAIDTVAADDTGAGVGRAGEIFAGLERGNDLEQAIQVAVTGPNVLTDYEPGTEISDRLVGVSVELRRYTTAVVFSPAERKGRADTMVLDGRVASHTGQVALDDRHVEKECFDVWTQTDDEGNVYRVRAERETYADGVHAFDVVLDDASILSSVGITTETDKRALTLAPKPETTLQLLDIPALRDADAAAPGYYAAAKGAADGWSGYSLLESGDGVSFAKVLDSSAACILGTCATALGDYAGGNVVDNANTVTVNCAAALASYTDDQMIAGTAQSYLIGDEIVMAREATLVSAGVYTLSGLLRGLRGTEWAMGTHAINERFTLLDAAVRRVADDVVDLDVSRYWKGVSVGRRAADVLSRRFTDTGVSLKPFAPVDLELTISDTETAVTWHRRSRMASLLLATAGTPLGEANESYSVELRDETATLISTDTVAEPRWASGGVTETGSVVAPVWGIATIGGEMVAVRDDQLGTYVTPKYLARYDSTGALVAQSPLLGYEIYQWCADGDALYAACATFNGGVPVTYLASTVKRLARTSIGTVAATYTAATAGDVQGIAHDGTDVWISEFYGGNLRKLDATTLASAATYALDVGITAMQHLSGDLWIVATASDEVIQWNIAGTSETQRFSVLPQPFDILLDSGLAYVLSSGGLGVYDQADGSLVASHTLHPPVNLAQRCMCKFGTYIAVADATAFPQVVVLFDAATGALVRRLNHGHVFLEAVSGEFASKLYITTSSSETSAATGAYELQAQDLAGYSVTVYQLSATVGRGYPATLEIPA